MGIHGAQLIMKHLSVILAHIAMLYKVMGWNILEEELREEKKKKLRIGVYIDKRGGN